ncbi:hypothetical protein LSAT2_006156 [Lamellibrachia satsuma]|nr:hypothetical protein LSAT2_006156 [Lamellibrachia satsuma]
MVASCFKFLGVCLLLPPAVIDCCSRRRTPKPDDTNCTYSLEVKTADVKWAGTDDDVRVVIKQCGTDVIGVHSPRWITLNKDGDDHEQKHRHGNVLFERESGRPRAPSRRLRYTRDVTAVNHSQAVHVHQAGGFVTHVTSHSWIGTYTVVADCFSEKPCL